MKKYLKITIFVLIAVLMVSSMSVIALASDSNESAVTEKATATEAPEKETANSGKLDQDMSGANMTFGERFEYAIQGTATGMLMIFAVLGLLWGIVSLSKVVFYDIPNKKKAKAVKNSVASVAEDNAASEVIEPIAEAGAEQNDAELAAVITAAIAAILESEEYKNEFVGGFRVVSFKRTSSGAWNRK